MRWVGRDPALRRAQRTRPEHVPQDVRRVDRPPVAQHPVPQHLPRARGEAIPRVEARPDVERGVRANQKIPEVLTS